MHCGGPTGPFGTTQQSSPGPQHCEPQQLLVLLQFAPGLHGGVPQVPLSQNGASPAHFVPQMPQLLMSLPVLTQWPLQQTSPMPQDGLQAPPPPVPVVVVSAPPVPLVATPPVP